MTWFQGWGSPHGSVAWKKALCQLGEGANTVLTVGGPGEESTHRFSGSAPCTRKGDGIPPAVPLGHSQVPLI